MLNLAGLVGSGRADLLREAVGEARAGALRVIHARIDLDGWEPGRVKGSDFLAFQAAKHQAQPAEIDLPDDANLAAVVRAVAVLLSNDRERLLAGDDLADLAANLAANERLLLDVTDSASLPSIVRERFLALAEQNPRVALALSTHPGDGHAKVARGRETVRIELMPLDPGEIAVVLNVDTARAEYLGDAYRGNRLVTRTAGDDESGPLAATIADVPEDRRKRIESFVHLAAICGENVPVHLLLDFLAVEADDRDEWIDLIDDHFGSDSDFALFADRFQHPSFPGQLIYGFADPGWVDVLRSRLPADSRSRLASQLLRAFVGTSPLDTRAAVRLAVELGRVAGEAHDSDRMELERELCWWVGQQDLDAAREHLADEVRRGARTFSLCWTTVNSVQFRWPPARTLAVLAAASASGVPASLKAPIEAIRSGLQVDAGHFAEAETSALRGIEIAEDKLLESALMERLGAARRAQGRVDQAEKDFLRSHQLRMELLAEGDARVVPMLRQYAQVLRANGREGDAAEIEKGLTAQKS